MPKYTRKLRKTRRSRKGGDENEYIVPKQVMPANEILEDTSDKLPKNCRHVKNKETT